MLHSGRPTMAGRRGTVTYAGLCRHFLSQSSYSIFSDVELHKEPIMNKDIMEGQWKQLTGKAKAAWGELTDNELPKVEGNAERLTGLIQEKYGKTREEAEKEVKRFFDDN